MSNKLLFPVLALSLAANGALAWRYFSAAPKPAPEASSPLVPQAAASASASAARAKTEASAQKNSESPAGDFSALRDRLTALGFPLQVVRAVVRNAIEEPRRVRLRELYAEQARQPWWQGQQLFSREQDREIRELTRREREEILRVLGPEGYVADEQLERYSFLPAEKAARLAVLQRDYAELRREASTDLNASRAELADRLKLLTAEHDRDVAALLTPEERARFDERESPAARSLSFRLEYFDANDAEYRAVLAAQRAFDERAPSTLSATSPEGGAARTDANRRMVDELKASLGEERYAQFIQAQRPEYRALVELQRRFDIPPAAFQQAARVHLDISAEAARIADDTATDATQKRALLTPLADRAIAGIRSALGPQLGDAYIAASRSTWIDVVARGGAYSASPNGSTGTRNFGPSPDRPVAPPPPRT